MYRPGKSSNLGLKLSKSKGSCSRNMLRAVAVNYVALGSWSRLTPERRYSQVDRNDNDCRILTAQCRLEETNVGEETCTVCSTYCDRWLNTTLAFETHTHHKIFQGNAPMIVSSQHDLPPALMVQATHWDTEQSEGSSVDCHECAVFSCCYYVGLCSPRQFNLQNYFEPDSCSGEGINLPLVRVWRSHIRGKL